MSSTRTSKTAGETRTDDGTPSGDVTPVVAVNGTEPDTSAPADPTPQEHDGDVPKMSELTGIRYVGQADVKELTAADLESLGVENPKGDLRWSKADNGFVVPTEQFNAATRDVLLEDPNFAAE